jgi:hypothetical protein
VDIGTAFPVQSWIAFSLADPVAGVGATLAPAQAGDGDPRLMASDENLAPLVARTAFPLDGGGFAGVVDPTSARISVVAFGTTASATTQVLQLDDLVIDLVPEPAHGTASAVALACLCALRRRAARRRRAET